MAYLNISRRQAGFALTTLAAFTFASKTILAKMAYLHGVDAVTVLALRMSFAGVIFASILICNVLRGKWSLRLPPAQWLRIVVLGVFGYYISALLDFSGLVYIDASLGRMILFLYPTLVVIINSLLSRKPVRGSVWLALGLCYGGIFLMLIPNLSAERSNVWLGSGLVFASAVIYAFYLVGVERLLKDIEPARFTSLVMCVSCLSVIIHYLLTRSPQDLMAVPAPVIVNGFIMGAFATALPIYALTAGIARIGAPLAAMVSMSGPVLTLIMGVMLLGERLTAIQLAGMLLVMAGVWRVGK